MSPETTSEQASKLQAQLKAAHFPTTFCVICIKGKGNLKLVSITHCCHAYFWNRSEHRKPFHGIITTTLDNNLQSLFYCRFPLVRFSRIDCRLIKAIDEAEKRPTMFVNDSAS